jgi:signal peptidase II
MPKKGIWTIVGILLIDQGTKLWVYNKFTSFPVLDEFLKITPVLNPYGIFGLNLRIPYTLLTGVGILVLGLIFVKSKNTIISLILGGAISSFIDRVRLGGVIDWIDIGIKNYRWPIFNLADAGITVGILLLIWGEISKNKKRKF